MNLLSLDIDGVLNRHIKQSNDYCGIEPDCVRALNYIIDNTDCKILLSSAWRYMILGEAMTLKGFEYLLLTHGVNCYNKLIGWTEKDPDNIQLIDETPRGQQILNWIKLHYLHYDSIVKLVVVDDLDLGISKKGLDFIQTDGKIGLTMNDAKRIVDKFNKR